MCDTLAALKNGTKNGNIIFAKNSDRAVNEPQYFVMKEGKCFDKNDVVQCTYLTIPQVPETKTIILSKPSWIWGGEMGVNESGVCIGNQAIYTKLVNEEPSLLGMDLLRLGLERGNTAKDALEVMTSLLEKYGQGGNGSFDAEYYYDNSFYIADHNEVWFLETAGKLWAAKKLESSDSISNTMSMIKPTVMSDATTKYLTKEHKRNNSDNFINSLINWDVPVNYSGMVRQSHSKRQLEINEPNITTETMIKILQSHTTEDPWLRGDFSICKHATGVTSAHQATNSFVAEYVNEDMIFWGTGMSLPCISLFKPFWFDVYGKNIVYDYSNQQNAIEYWLTREQINRNICEGRIEEKEYKQELTEIQESWFKLTEGIEKSDRHDLCAKIDEEEEHFIEKWLNLALKETPKPLGSNNYFTFWQGKNLTLGQNRKVL